LSKDFFVCEAEICGSIIEFNDPRGMLHYSARVDAIGLPARQSVVQIPSSVSAFGSQAAGSHFLVSWDGERSQSPYFARVFVLIEELHLPRKNCLVNSRGETPSILLALRRLTGKCEQEFSISFVLINRGMR
jgi:hypothetical protein